jgi:hypothetical protein
MMQTPVPGPVVAQIAGLVFELSADGLYGSIRLGEAYRDFLCAEQPEIRIRARVGELPRHRLRKRDRIFDSQKVWQLYRAGKKNVFVFQSDVVGPEPYCVAVFDAAFLRGDVYLSSAAFGAISQVKGFDPLQFPLSEALMVCLLGRGRGLMVHACGVVDGERGYLFAGNSTHGKSTMAQQWEEKGLVLNDDRIVLRRRENRVWMYGTPWHGAYTAVSARGVRLDKLFFLRHARVNSARRVEGTRAASMLLSRSFIPLWDGEGMRYTLDFCSGLTAETPCFELGFIPDRQVVELVRCAA